MAPPLSNTYLGNFVVEKYSNFEFKKKNRRKER